MNDSFESYVKNMKNMYESNFGKDDAKFDQMHKDMYKIDQDLNKINQTQQNNIDDSIVYDHSDCEHCPVKSECNDGNISITIKDPPDEIQINADMALVYHRNKIISGVKTSTMDYYDLMHALDTILDFYTEKVNVDLPKFLTYYIQNHNAKP